MKCFSKMHGWSVRTITLNVYMFKFVEMCSKTLINIAFLITKEALFNKFMFFRICIVKQQLFLYLEKMEFLCRYFDSRFAINQMQHSVDVNVCLYVLCMFYLYRNISMGAKETRPELKPGNWLTGNHRIRNMIQRK